MVIAALGSKQAGAIVGVQYTVTLTAAKALAARDDLFGFETLLIRKMEGLSVDARLPAGP